MPCLFRFGYEAIVFHAIIRVTQSFLRIRQINLRGQVGVNMPGQWAAGVAALQFLEDPLREFLCRLVGACYPEGVLIYDAVIFFPK